MSYDGGDNYGDNSYVNDSVNNCGSYTTNEDRSLMETNFGSDDRWKETKTDDEWKERKSDDEWKEKNDRDEWKEPNADDGYGRNDSIIDQSTGNSQNEYDGHHTGLLFPMIGALMRPEDTILPELDLKEKMNGDGLTKPMLPDEYNDNRQELGNDDNNCSVADCCYYSVVCCDCTIL